MSYVAKGDKEYDATGAPAPGAKIHKIRITLTSSNVKNLEKCVWNPFSYLQRH
jgi:small subunit ribosomal protein S20e